MATMSQLNKALINADKAGDLDAARKLAKIISVERARRSENPDIDRLESIPDYGESNVPNTTSQKSDGSMLDRAAGVGEAALTIGSGIVGGSAGMIEGTVEGIVKEIIAGEFGSNEAADRIEKLAMERAQALTYSPRTEVGQEITQDIGETLAPLAAIPPFSEVQMVASAANRVPIKAMAQQKVVQPVKEAVQPKVKNLANQISKKVSERFVKTPEKSAGTGTSAGAQAVDAGDLRQSQADELPIPIKLTRGQKTRDFEDQRFERETAKDAEKGGRFRERFQQQNLQLQQNMDAFIDATGAELTDLRGVGEVVDKALRSRAARDKTKIRTLYKAAEKSGEMEAPVKLNNLIQHLKDSSPEAEVANVLKAAKAKAIQLGALKEDSNGDLVASPISIKNAELLRRSINSATNVEPTNIRQAQIMKKLIDEETAELGGAAYKKARKARAKYSRDYENVGLVKQILNTKRGSDDRVVAMEDVVRKAILQPSSSLDTIRQLRKLLQTEGESGMQAWRELQGATLRHIKDEASKSVQIDQTGNRIVSPAQLDRVIKNLDKSGKLDFIFTKKGAEQLRTINEVAQDVLTSPPGVINTSNTASVLAGLMDVAISGTAGVPAPIMSSFRVLSNSIKDKKLKARINKALGDE